MTSREKILSRIRSQKNRGPLEDAEKNRLKAKIEGHSANIIPKRAQIPLDQQVNLFQEKMEALSTTVVRVDKPEDIPASVQSYLAQHNLPSRIKMSPSKQISGLDWASIPTLEMISGAGAEEDDVGISPAFAGIAETGTLMMASGVDTPSTINFLPENHIAVLNMADMKGSFEETWDALRAIEGEGNMPRTVNLISGPSRTADIEQRLIMGAHGPKRLHVILVGDGT